MANLKKGEFFLNGYSSLEVNSLIQERPAIPTPNRRIDLRSVPGVSGDYIFDDESYENTEIKLSLYTKGQTENEVNQLKSAITYLFDTGDYAEFVPYWGEWMVYHVATVEGPTFIPDGNVPLLLNYELTLSVKPFKYYIGNTTVEGESELLLINPYNYEANPLIKIKGSGDIDLTVNGQLFKYRNVDGNICIDSEVFHAYKEVTGGILDRDDRVYQPEYPVLRPGDNTIKVAGPDVQSFSVEPRWRQLVS